MESEFKVKEPKPPSIPAMRLMVDSLRKSREEHPVVDMVAGNLPIVGGIQAGMDVSDPSASTLSRSLALASVIPGGKLVGTIAKRLRGLDRKIPTKILDRVAQGPPKPAKVEPNLDDFSAWGDLFKTPAKTDKKVVQDANEAYIKQLLAEEGLLGE